MEGRNVCWYWYSSSWRVGNLPTFLHHYCVNQIPNNPRTKTSIYLYKYNNINIHISIQLSDEPTTAAHSCSDATIPVSCNHLSFQQCARQRYQQHQQHLQQNGFWWDGRNTSRHDDRDDDDDDDGNATTAGTTSASCDKQ